ncbi:MAG: hypothetical protein HOO94_03430 [Novosphingobium sp.]|nr:hypothetical protein [Novosphingobium sp.]
MTTIAKLIAACLVVSATTAAADPVTTAPAPTAEQPKPKKVCRSVVVTGSIMPNRVCRTKEEWAAINSQRIDVTDRSKDAGRVPAGRESLGQ